MQHILTVTLRIFGHRSKEKTQILQRILQTWEPASHKHYSANDIREDKKLLQETNPVRLQPSADTLPAQA